MKKFLTAAAIMVAAGGVLSAQPFKLPLKDNGSKTEATKPEEKKGYAAVITADAKTSKGIIDLHMVKGTLYLEIPKKIMGKPFLFAARIEQTSNNKESIAGQMPNDPLMIEFSFDNDKVYIHTINNRAVCDPKESIFKGVLANNLNPVLKSFPIKCYSLDSSKVVIDVTKYFCSDEKPMSPFTESTPFDGLFGIKRMSGSFKADNSSILRFHSFPKNISVSSRLSFTSEGAPFSCIMNISMILLPEHPMKPRYSDHRVGYFTDGKHIFSTTQNQVMSKGYINRWNLEPKAEDVEKHKRGELVEPAKQIVYYIDPSFPAEWRPFIKEGIEDWQMAFEKIGFKNAIVAKDYPANDSLFNPNDIRNSCIVYSASNVANAMGPSWTDPRSGEIIQGSVYVYHNVLSLLRNWRFIQTSTVDPKAREKVLSLEVMGPLMRYLIAHEIGHTLGLMHNMRGSYAYPVDSLRSPSFTAVKGTTSSIMDYARYNYVAQPGDGVTQLLPPRLGPYDYYAIKFGYSKIYEANTPDQESAIINKWLVEKCNDPEYKFGAQEVFGTTDPAAQTEAIGDDAIKASVYGIRNLKIITKNLIDWTAEEGKDYSYTASMYKEVVRQYTRYLTHCSVYLGGSYINYSVKGDNQKETIAVSKAKQKEAVKFLLGQIYEMPEWLNSKALAYHLGEMEDNVGELQTALTRLLTNPSMIGRIGTCAKGSTDPYTQQEFVKDVYETIWAKTIKGQSINRTDKLVQYVYIHSLLGSLDMLPAEVVKNKSFAFCLENSLNNVDQFESIPVTAEQLERQMTISTKESEVKIQSKSILYSQLTTIKSLLASRIPTSTGETKEHYRYLLYQIEKLMK